MTWSKPSVKNPFLEIWLFGDSEAYKTSLIEHYSAFWGGEAQDDKQEAVNWLTARFLETVDLQFPNHRQAKK